MRTTLLFFFCGWLMTSCNTYEDFGLDETITLKAGEQARFVHNKQEKTLLSFAGITEDSRCPRYTKCIWEGQAMVALQLGKNPTDSLFLNMRSGQGQHQDIDFFGHRLELLEVNPYPEDGSNIKPEEYSIKLVVARVERP